MPIREKNVRSVPPNTFTGKYEDREEFSFRCKAYISLADPRAARALSAAEKLTSPVTEDIPVTRNAEGREVDLRLLSSHIFHQPIQLTNGPPYAILRGTEGANGLEAWRHMHNRCQIRHGPKAIGKLSNLLKPTFPEAHFEDAFAQWEFNLREFETDTKLTLPDFIDVAVTKGALTGPLLQHVQLNSTSVDTVVKIRDMLLEYFKSKTDFSRRVSNSARAVPQNLYYQQPVPMEIDAYFKKGKGKGKHRKGGKSGKGKGSTFSKGSSTKGKSWVWNPPATSTGKGRAPMEGIEEASKT